MLDVLKLYLLEYRNILDKLSSSIGRTQIRCQLKSAGQHWRTFYNSEKWDFSG